MHTRDRTFRLTTVVTATGFVIAQITPLTAIAQGVPSPPPLASYSQLIGTQQPGVDPPARVGRLALVSGTVSYHTRDDTQWSPAVVNYPVTAGNAYWTQPNAQAEIEVSASRIAMAPATELDVTALDDTNFQASEPQGESYLRLRAGAPGESYTVQTPRGLVALAVPGRYDVVAGDTQTPTTVTVIDGSAQVTGPGLSLQVGAGQAAAITGTDTFQGQVGPAQPDPYLTAMLSRDQPPQQAAAAPVVVAEMPGGDELAAYGSWSDNPDYGQVWYPQVAPDWVPYSDGSWSYVAPWGWTWVDSDPWGFAPFHYGRWAQIGGRWGWVPGRESVYAPAMVAFFGLGVGVGVGAALATGHVGWLPLGPREAYHPWYRASDRYLQRVNTGPGISATTLSRTAPLSSFANRGAAMVAPSTAITSSRPMRGVAQRVDPAQLAQARPVLGQQPLRPTLATAGVTPGVARQLQLAPSVGSVAPHPAAPGPAIRPAGVFPGAAGTAAVARPRQPPLHNPAGSGIGGAPAGAAAVRPLVGPSSSTTPGVRPATVAPGGAPGLPALRGPVAPGQAGPPPIEHGQGLALPGPRPGAEPQAGHPAALAPAAPIPAVNHPVAPAPATTPAFHAAPVVHAPPPAPAAPPAPRPAPPPSPVVHAPPPAPRPAPPPAPVVHAPPPAPAPHPAPAPAPQRQKKPGEP